MTVGYGDNIMASGMAKGAAARGKRIAFGEGGKIFWDHCSEPVFRGNPNVAPPGTERTGEPLEWINFRRGHRMYNRQAPTKWVWNYGFKPTPGELFFTKEEVDAVEGQGVVGAVLIEPMVPAFKSVAPNKDWGFDRWSDLASRLRQAGVAVCQPYYEGARLLDGTRPVKVANFREAACAVSRAAIYVGPEGGLHHAAAAVGKRAVVIFGGFIPPQVTGYDSHVNLTGSESTFCGSLSACEHCRKALDRISVDEVLERTLEQLNAAKQNGGIQPGDPAGLSGGISQPDRDVADGSGRPQADDRDAKR